MHVRNWFLVLGIEPLPQLVFRNLEERHRFLKSASSIPGVKYDTPFGGGDRNN
jgi:hypothetical protein